MTSDDAGPPQNTPTDIDGDAEAEQPPGAEQSARRARITRGVRERSTHLADRAKTTAGHLTGQARSAVTQQPSRSWRAVTAAGAR